MGNIHLLKVFKIIDDYNIHFIEEDLICPRMRLDMDKIQNIPRSGQMSKSPSMTSLEDPKRQKEDPSPRIETKTKLNRVLMK